MCESSSQHWVLRHCFDSVWIFIRPNEHRNAPLPGPQKITYHSLATTDWWPNSNDPSRLIVGSYYSFI